jgi:hypothetical protein
MRFGDFLRQPDLRFKSLVIAIDERDKRNRHLKTEPEMGSKIRIGHLLHSNKVMAGVCGRR